MRHRLLLCAALLMGTGIALAMTFSRGYTNPKLDSGEATIARACIMPAAAQLQRVGMKGHEGMAEESDTWSTQLQGIVENHLKEVGVTITSSGMSSAELEKNDQLRQTVLQVQQKYDSVATQMDRKNKDVKKSRYTLGDEVTLLPCSANSDALVFIHGEGNVLTGGKKAFGTLVGGASRSSASLRVTFVDAKSGDVLAYTVFVNDGKFEGDSEAAYGKAISKEFTKVGIGPRPPKK